MPWRAASVVAGLAAVIVFRYRIIDHWRLSIVYLAPVALAAYWFGRWAGFAAGLAVTIAFPHLGQEGHFLASVRLAAYSFGGYALGYLFQQRSHLQREVEELQTVQDALTPAQLPERPGLEMATVYVPAEHGVAGDFHLITEGPGGTTIVIIGDVVGHGIEASRRAAFVRTLLASFAPFTDDPCRLLELANTALIEHGANEGGSFVTAACIVHHPGDTHVRFALAGHPTPIALDEATPLTGTPPSPPLGIDRVLDCSEGSWRMDPGSGFLLFTDGLPEARRKGEQFGFERIREELLRLQGAPPRQVVDTLRADAERFAGGRLPDDLCMVAVRAAG